MSAITKKSTVTMESGILSVIQQAALNPDVDVSKMEKLLDMQERILKENRRIAFHDAMAKLQSDLPVITERGEITHSGKLISKYAKFEDINNAIRPHLRDHGFSVTFRSAFPEGMLEVTGIISHREGHCEETTMRLPFDTSGSKNNVQAIGSSVSYGKRYVLCMLLNISTGGEDDDAATFVEYITEEQAADLLSLLETDERIAKFKAWAKIERLEDIPAKNYNALVAKVKPL